MTEAKSFHHRFKENFLGEIALSLDVLKRRFQSQEIEETEEETISLLNFFIFPKVFNFSQLPNQTTMIQAIDAKEALKFGVKQLIEQRKFDTSLFEEYLYTYHLSTTFLEQFIKKEDGSFIDIPRIEYNSADHGYIHDKVKIYFRGDVDLINEVEESIFNHQWKPPYSDELKNYILMTDENFLNYLMKEYEVKDIELKENQTYLVSEQDENNDSSFKVLYSEKETDLFNLYYETFYDFNNKKDFSFIYDFYANTGLGKSLYEDQKGICFDLETGELRQDLKLFLTNEEAIEDYLLKNLRENTELLFGDRQDFCQIFLNYALATEEQRKNIVFSNEMIHFIINRCNKIDIGFTLKTIKIA